MEAELQKSNKESILALAQGDTDFRVDPDGRGVYMVTNTDVNVFPWAITVDWEGNVVALDEDSYLKWLMFRYER